jgi:hypothetical protein
MHIALFIFICFPNVRLVSIPLQQPLVVMRHDFEIQKRRTTCNACNTHNKGRKRYFVAILDLCCDSGCVEHYVWKYWEHIPQWTFGVTVQRIEENIIILIVFFSTNLTDTSIL